MPREKSSELSVSVELRSVTAALLPIVASHNRRKKLRAWLSMIINLMVRYFLYAETAVAYRECRVNLKILKPMRFGRRNWFADLAVLNIIVDLLRQKASACRDWALSERCLNTWSYDFPTGCLL